MESSQADGVILLFFIVYAVDSVYKIAFFSRGRRHTTCGRDWSSDVCSSDLFPLRIQAMTACCPSSSDVMGAFTADEDGKQAVMAWMRKGKYGKLLELWVKGLMINWKDLYGEHLPRRISLPTYPFAQERYWLPPPTSEPTANSRVASQEALSALHPLVQRNTSTLWEQRFSSTFRGDEFFLADHVVKGQRIMPAVAYLEMARAAVIQAIGADTSHKPSGLRLSHIQWVRPLVLSSHPAMVPQTLRSKPADNSFVLHPSMLDSAFQACIGLLTELDEYQKPRTRLSQTIVPFALDELEIVGEMPTQGWAWVRRSTRRTTEQVFDIELCDDEGR